MEEGGGRGGGEEEGVQEPQHFLSCWVRQHVGGASIRHTLSAFPSQSVALALWPHPIRTLEILKVGVPLGMVEPIAACPRYVPTCCPDAGPLPWRRCESAEVRGGDSELRQNAPTPQLVNLMWSCLLAHGRWMICPSRLHSENRIHLVATSACLDQAYT